MADYNQEIGDFQQFATAKLKTHISELQTRYENEEIDKDTLDKGYAEHRTILEQELKEKADTIVAGKESTWLKDELNNITSNIVKQLSNNHS